ncbi:hypothetical protein ACQR18_26320 [Bradyrhizobium oligotrophicum]|uniref:hypothetical protein n=1 Tax=Bradyrhizobium oligotrophicum TaxID=44255 RepID=UPI003EBD8850
MGTVLGAIRGTIAQAGNSDCRACATGRYAAVVAATSMSASMGLNSMRHRRFIVAEILAFVSGLHARPLFDSLIFLLAASVCRHLGIGAFS